MKNFTVSLDGEQCWDAIGVNGNFTCPELTTYTHCRNCPVYSATGCHLLERPIPKDYRHEWTQLLAESTSGTEIRDKLVLSPKDSRSQSQISPTTTLTVVIFRLKQEWLALPAQVFQEATLPAKIHSVPYRSNDIFQGLVSIRGELQLCISLSHLLNLDASDTLVQTLSPIVYARMVVVKKAGHSWVFAVDELYGIHHFHQNELRDTPRSMTLTTQSYTKGLFLWQSHSVSYLDDELLFHTLDTKVVA